MFDRPLHSLVNVLDRSLPRWVKTRIKASNPRLVDAVYHELAKRTSDHPVRVTVQSGPLQGRPLLCSLKHQRSCYLGNFEPWKTEVLRGALRPGMVFFDIGAHIGYFSLIAAAEVRPGGKVVAFEPEPKNVSQFRQNVALNADLAPFIQLENVAMSDGVGAATFESGSNSYVGHLTTTDKAGGINVATTTTDAFVDQSGLRPDFIKIDVEGAESRVFSGMRRTLTAHRPTMLIEIHGANGHVAFASMLQQYDYDSRQVQMSTAAEAALVGWDALSEFVATPR